MIEGSRSIPSVIDCSHKRRMAFDPPSLIPDTLKINPLPVGVAGVDQKIDIGALHQRLSMLKRGFRFLDRPD